MYDLSESNDHPGLSFTNKRINSTIIVNDRTLIFLRSYPFSLFKYSVRYHRTKFEDRTIEYRIFTFDEIIFWMKISSKGNSGTLVMQIFC